MCLSKKDYECVLDDLNRFPRYPERGNEVEVKLKWKKACCLSEGAAIMQCV